MLCNTLETPYETNESRQAMAERWRPLVRLRRPFESDPWFSLKGRGREKFQDLEMRWLMDFFSSFHNLSRPFFNQLDQSWRFLTPMSVSEKNMLCNPMFTN